MVLSFPDHPVVSNPDYCGWPVWLIHHITTLYFARRPTHRTIVLDIKPEPTEPVTDRASPQIYTKQTRPRPRLALAQTAQGKCLPRLPLGAGEISAVPVAALVSPRRPVTQPKLGPRLVSREGGREAERKVRTSLSRRPAGKEPRGTCSRCACGVAEVAGANCLILTSRIPGRYGTCFSRAAHAAVEPCAVNRICPCRCVRKESEYRNPVRAYPIERLRAYRYQQVLLERRVCLWKVLRPHDRPRFVYLRCALWTAHLHLHLHLACGCNFGKRPPGPASPFHEPGSADRGAAPAQPIEPGLTAEPGHRIHFQRACQCVPRPWVDVAATGRCRGSIPSTPPPPRRSTANDSSAGLGCQKVRALAKLSFFFVFFSVFLFIAARLSLRAVLRLVPASPFGPLLCTWVVASC